MVEARVRVLYGDTDQMGIVYYANYLRYFELSRNEYLRARNFSYRQLEADGIILPVVDVQARYHASARYDDLLVIQARIVELRRVSLTFSYEIRREGSEQLLCSGRTVQASLGKEGKPTRIPPHVAQLLTGHKFDNGPSSP